MTVQSIASTEQHQTAAPDQTTAEYTFQAGDFDLTELAPARDRHHIPRWVWNCFVGSLMIFGGTVGFTSLTSTGPVLISPSNLSELDMPLLQTNSESQANQGS